MNKPLIRISHLFLVLTLLLSSFMATSCTAKKDSHKGIKFIKEQDGISEYRLDNGLKILLKPEANAPLISWQVWYKVGSRNERSGLTGLAHYLEHIMFKGTKDFQKGEIAQAIQLKGGLFNAFTGDDYTAYYENFAPENLELAIKIEADRMKNSRLDAEEIDKERSVIISELEGGENMPQNTVYKTLKSTAYQAHPYRNPIIGWDSDLQNVNAENMREFYDRYYHPNNSVAVLAGNFDKDLALDLINKYFANHPREEMKVLKITKEPKQTGLRKAVIQKEGLVKMLSMGFHIPEFSHEDSAALHVIADIVFDGTSSRLYKKLVDPGKVINVSGYAEASIDPGLFRVSSNINLATDINEVEKTIDAELESIKSGVSTEELERAKARVEASAIYERDGVYNEALQIGYFEAISSWEDYPKWVETINKVSNDDIKEVAKKYFTQSNKTVVHLLPEEPKDSLIANNSVNSSNRKLREQGYGAATVEPLNPEKLKRLLELTKPKYSKDFFKGKTKLDLNLKNLELSSNLEKLKAQVVYKEDHKLPIIYINAVYFAGTSKESKYETKPGQKKGLAYLTAEMLERGTLKNDKFEISNLLDIYGADISFMSRKETAEFEISTLSKNLDKVLKLFEDHIYKAKFDPSELEKLKKETIAHIRQENEYLHNITHRDMNRIIYPEDHPYYSFSPDEKIQSIESITIEDVKKFYKENYNPQNIMISIVGDISEQEIDKKFLPLLESWNIDKNSKHEETKPSIPVTKAKKPEEKTVTMEEKRQVEILMGHATEVTRMHPDFYALLIANYALGGSPLSSRLGTVVRDEHGLVYDVRSGFKSTLGAGAFELSLGCNPKNVTKAIKISKEVVNNFLKEGISETELEATKSYLAGSFAARNLGNNETTSRTISSMLLYDLNEDYLENYSEIINSISLEEVNNAAKKHIKPDMLNVVIAGPEFE